MWFEGGLHTLSTLSYKTWFKMNFKRTLTCLSSTVDSLLFLEKYKKDLVDSPSEDRLHRLVHLDALPDLDVMLRD